MRKAMTIQRTVQLFGASHALLLGICVVGAILLQSGAVHRTIEEIAFGTNLPAQNAAFVCDLASLVGGADAGGPSTRLSAPQPAPSQAIPQSPVAPTSLIEVNEETKKEEFQDF